MDKAELEFRRDLSTALMGRWRLTWHEDGSIGPGVPDCSFVMLGGKCETGWLELKATFLDSGPYKFKLEPSQHVWITAHLDLIPVYLLLASPKHVWLLNSEYHNMIDGRALLSRHLDEHCYTRVERSDLVSLSKPLREVTTRSRINGGF
jgi:hypothetical protein